MPRFPQEPGRANRALRSVWFGMRCEFTRAALEGAMGSPDGLMPISVVLPASPRPKASGWPEPPFDRWLRSLGIEVIELCDSPKPEWRAVRERSQQLRATVGIGACFPYKVPRDIRDVLPLGVVNIHPSLLPELRGPDPVTDALRLGMNRTGVTLHLMDDGWDTGPVLAQEAVTIPGDVDARAFETSLARRGGELLAPVIAAWQAGDMAPQPQDEWQASSTG